MDNFNNNGVPSTPNPLNDNSSTPNNDYNSMQPQSNTTVDESVQPNLATPTVPEIPVVEEQPAIQQNPTIGSTTPNDQGIAMENLVQSMDTSVPEEPVVEIPVQEEVVAPTMDSAPVEFETTPIVETPPMTDPMAQPLENSMPSMETTPPPMEAVQPMSMEETPQPMQSETFNTAPVDETTDVGTTTMQTDSINTLEGVDSQPAFTPTQVEATQSTPDMSTNLSQPFSTAPEAPQEPTVQSNDEVVSTLGESSGEGKDSSVVIVVLVVIIVLLLAGIGYFGYQIFLG